MILPRRSVLKILRHWTSKQNQISSIVTPIIILYIPLYDSHDKASQNNIHPNTDNQSQPNWKNSTTCYCTRFSRWKWCWSIPNIWRTLIRRWSPTMRWLPFRGWCRRRQCWSVSGRRRRRRRSVASFVPHGQDDDDEFLTLLAMVTFAGDEVKWAGTIKLEDWIAFCERLYRIRVVAWMVTVLCDDQDWIRSFLVFENCTCQKKKQWMFRTENSKVR